VAKPNTAAEYFAAQPPAQRRMLKALRSLVKTLAPSATEELSYGMPTYRVGGKPLVYFGAWAEHCSVYGLPMEKVPAKYLASKGTIQLRLDQPIPERLLGRLLKARLRTIDAPGY